MLCYRDMSFCPFYQTCLAHTKCGRALTPEVKAKAESHGLPICQYQHKPPCYDPGPVKASDADQDQGPADGGPLNSAVD